jgi:hypothetical protein
MKEKLDSIEVLWREHAETMSLWGIPYKMDVKIGQGPIDLFRYGGKANASMSEAEMHIFCGDTEDE